MQKDYPVMRIKISEISGYIEKTDEIYDESRVPIGVYIFGKNGERHFIPENLNRWWIGRSIPASRQGIKEVLEKLNITNTALLLKKSFALSLSDHYWVKPLNQDIKWSDINFFGNSFSQDMGELMFGSLKSKSPTSLIVPENSSDGWLKKRWVIKNGKRFLVKGSDGPNQQEAFNEEVASLLCERLGIEHVKYEAYMARHEGRCLCENFLGPSTEFVSAWNVLASVKRKNNESQLEHLTRTCQLLNIPLNQKKIDQMIVLDYLISNTDRHDGNYGFLRNTETLEWIGLAPIFDNGTSFWNKTNRIGKDNTSRTFAKTHEKQIQLVSDLSWFDIEKLDDFSTEIKMVFEKNTEIEPSRVEKIIQSFGNRVEDVQTLKIEKKTKLNKVEYAPKTPLIKGDGGFGPSN